MYIYIYTCTYTYIDIHTYMYICLFVCIYRNNTRIHNAHHVATRSAGGGMTVFPVYTYICIDIDIYVYI